MISMLKMDTAQNNDISINEAINEVLEKIAAAENYFENTYEPDLVEASIYRIKSLKAEYSHLIKLAKREETVV